MNFDTVLKAKIETATGYPVYALEKPLEKGVPCIVYRTINEFALLGVNSAAAADTGIRRARVQLTAIAASQSALRTLTDAIEGLYGDDADFKAFTPLSTKLEDKEDNLYYSIGEYSVWYDKNQ